MPGLSPMTLNGLISRAKAGDSSAIASLQASGYDAAGRVVTAGTGGLAAPVAPAKPQRPGRKPGAPVPSTVQVQRANTYARMLRRMVGK